MATSKDFEKASNISHGSPPDQFQISLKEAEAGWLIGSRPLGLTSLGNTIAMAAYYEPSVLLAEVVVDGGGLLIFRDVHSIAMTQDQEGHKVRMFPSPSSWGDANRMQVAVLFSKHEIGLVRNGERRIFQIVKKGDGKWHHVDRPDLPDEPPHMHYLHSAALTSDENDLLTVESSIDLGEWRQRVYRGGKLYCDEHLPMWRYGIAMRSDGAVYTITDGRSKEPKGIYRSGRLIVPGIAGNSIALINDGRDGALVSHYGGTPTPFGEPGRLSYVPPEKLLL